MMSHFSRSRTAAPSPLTVCPSPRDVCDQRSSFESLQLGLVAFQKPGSPEPASDTALPHVPEEGWASRMRFQPLWMTRLPQSCQGTAAVPQPGKIPPCPVLFERQKFF